MKVHWLYNAFRLLLISLPTPTTPHPTVPIPPENILKRQITTLSYASIASVTFAGPGCPSDSASLSISDDLTVMTAIFSEFSIQTYGAIEDTMFCQINIDLDFPGGWSYTVTDVVQRGHVALGANITGVVGMLFYFSGSDAQANVSNIFAGPYDHDYEIQTGAMLKVYSPCNSLGDAAINLVSSLSLSQLPGSTNYGSINVGSVDAAFKQHFQLDWKNC